MTAADPVRTLAQADPITNLAARWGHITLETRAIVDQLEQKLRDLDTVTGQLAERGAVVATDLGATGNAARSAFQATVVDAGSRPFTLPGAA